MFIKLKDPLQNNLYIAKREDNSATVLNNCKQRLMIV